MIATETKIPSEEALACVCRLSRLFQNFEARLKTEFKYSPEAMKQFLKEAMGQIMSQIDYLDQTRKFLLGDTI